MTEQPTPSEPSPTDQPSPGDPARLLRSEDLLQGAREVWIEHGNERYRLRLTASGKLYLTK
jgi:hemin uptake protein HemP